MLDLQAIDLKKEIEELKRNDPGKARGISIKFLVNYVRQREGKEGLKKVKIELKRLGYELPDISKIDNIEWIPSSLPTIFMLASAKQFSWQEKDIIETGKNIASISITVKIFIKFFISPKKTFEIAARNWKRHYTFGELNLVEYDQKRKILIVRLKNYKRHPIVCMHLQGALLKIIEMATGKKKITAKETKCEFRGDPYHEYVFKWE